MYVLRTPYLPRLSRGDVSGPSTSHHSPAVSFTIIPTPYEVLTFSASPIMNAAKEPEIQEMVLLLSARLE